MKNLTIFILVSMVIVTLVGLQLIPQLMAPDYYYYYNVTTVARKTAKPDLSKRNVPVPVSGCDAGAYGMDCLITEYLEKTFLQPVKAGKVFCAYDKMGASDSGDIIYLNYSCEEFYLSGGKIYEGGGQAGPAKVIVADNGSLSYWVPRDGSYFSRDIREFFPPDYHEAAMNPAREKISQINRERGRKYFNADFDYAVEKTTDVSCNYDFECSTPAEYMLMSRCPFTSKCIGGKCAVICPNFQGLPKQ